LVCHADTLDTIAAEPSTNFAIRDKRWRNVQEQAASMPPKKQKAKSDNRRTVDRRVRRTRDSLGDALVALIQERKFEDITVQDVLDRAGVGRSTFYVHYRDKEDLFLSDVEEFLELISNGIKRHAPNSKRLLPVQEFFTHLQDVREFYFALVKSGKAKEVETLGRGIFARSIEERLLSAGVKMDDAQRSAHAHALAGSFFSLLEWWIDKGMKEDPRRMDEIFHRMAWSGLADV
jgi:AcrR family transcriptional regulator